MLVPAVETCEQLIASKNFERNTRYLGFDWETIKALIKDKIWSHHFYVVT